MLFAFRRGKSTIYPQTFQYPEDRGISFLRCPSCGGDHIASYAPPSVSVDEGSMWPDILDGSWPLIVTERVAGLFRDARLTGISIEPIVVKAISQRLRNTAMPNYHVLRIEPWGITPLAEKTRGVHNYQSPARPLSNFPDLCITCGVFKDLSSPSLKSLELDMSLWRGRDFSAWNRYLFVTRKVMEILLENKASNCHFTHPQHAWDVTGKSLKNLPRVVK